MSSRPDPLGFLNTELDSLQAQGLYRSLRLLEGEASSHATFDHTSVVNLWSNNYLGLTSIRSCVSKAPIKVFPHKDVAAAHRTRPAWLSLLIQRRSIPQAQFLDRL